ncbi:hypothetical protein [Aporhodopirellula aestuarii]|uniref:Uncharacterized protein n=1 Tax=Aporhodopirellula aestuarii TaxID=2950107 RepID=A0ABT0UA46_9BACT|nr:hypothetical protein [Aporhodopirellula aestuarii]MCM2373390.1 hypothetical protein [Aporhodopirellula aestuarii]
MDIVFGKWAGVFRDTCRLMHAALSTNELQNAADPSNVRRWTISRPGLARSNVTYQVGKQNDE